jgi:hypothetical protein
VFEFLWRELELKLELEHLMSILEYMKDFFEAQEAGLASSHPVFIDNDVRKTEHERLEDTLAMLEESDLMSKSNSTKKVGFSVDISREEEKEQKKLQNYIDDTRNDMADHEDIEEEE